eukprot:maker-scaffold_7-snap-gene-18.45-mRNA-1 protein AED:0.02 eAED:0.02 QI:0/0/0/1/1/1/2/0/649
MSKASYVLENRKSFEDVFGGVDFDPHFSYFQADEKKRTSLEFNNVNYFINDKQILNGITGRIDAGEITALMGSSGAGKSSLMNVLAGRVVTGGKKRVEAEIKVNGIVMEPREYRRKVAYVMQDDLLFPTATVRESLDFSARLRLPASIADDDEQRDQIVTDLIESLGLAHVQDTKVGSVNLRGVSGGERKRVAIGIELVTNPKLLFLDEPTSGLDSFNAWKVIKILQNLGKVTGSCILCTIHQPSSEVFNEFENVVILSKGSIMYNGTVTEMPEIMSLLGRPIPGLTNPADYVMLVSQTMPQDELVRFNADTGYSKPEINREPRPALVYNELELHTRPGIFDEDEEERLSSFTKEIKLLSRREFKSIHRDPTAQITSFGTKILLNLIIGAIFYMSVDQDESDFTVTVAVSAILFAYIGLFSAALQPQLLNFPLDRGIMLREYQTGTYGSASYLLSKLVIEIPEHFISSLLTFIVMYFLLGMTANFFYVVCLGALTAIAASSLGQVIGAAVSDAKAAQEYSPVLLFPQMLFSGLFIPINSIPSWLRWLQYISIIKYAASVGAILEFDDCGDADDLFNLELRVDNCTDSGLDCTALEERYDYRSECLAVLDNQNISEDDVGWNLAVLFALAVGFRFVSLATLVYRANYFTD